MALRHRNDSTLSLLLHRQAVRQPEAPAVMAPGRTPLTYGGLAQQVGDVDAALAERGFTPSTRVAIVLPNGPEMATAFLGVASGAVCAPLNPAYQAAEFRFYLEDSRANAIVVTKGERGPARQVADEMGLAVLEIEADLSLAAGRFAIGAASGTALCLSSRS